jgi:Protein of unknown function (DUF2568)
MTRRDAINLVMRVTVECGVVAALAYWGANTGSSTAAHVALAIGAPLVGFGFWGAVDFHQAGRFAEPLRLTQELVVSGVAAVAAYTAGAEVFGIGLAFLSVIYHALVYLSGARLLKVAA